MNDETIIQHAQFRRGTETGSKDRASVAPRMADRIDRRHVSDNYRPLGVIVNQIPDRIHTISDPGNGGGLGSLMTYTFTTCVNGAPKDFVIPIVSGPT